jgi:hypothetical protein
MLASLAAVALVISACGDDSKNYRFEVHPTDGKVVYKGQPVPKAIVRFHPTDPSALKLPEGKEGPTVTLTTETDQQGEFKASTYLANDGLPAGDYKVTVASGLPEVDIENADDGKTKGSKAAPASLSKYRDPATTTLKASVKPGENHLVLELQ